MTGMDGTGHVGNRIKANKKLMNGYDLKLRNA